MSHLLLTPEFFKGPHSTPPPATPHSSICMACSQPLSYLRSIMSDSIKYFDKSLVVNQFNCVSCSCQVDTILFLKDRKCLLSFTARCSLHWVHWVSPCSQTVPSPSPGSAAYFLREHGHAKGSPMHCYSHLDNSAETSCLELKGAVPALRTYLSEYTTLWLHRSENASTFRLSSPSHTLASSLLIVSFLRQFSSPYSYCLE